MFTAETDRSLGLPVVHMPYKEGEAGIAEQSIPTICKKIREGMVTAVMKSYAGNVIKQSGTLQGSTKDRAIALVSHVHQAAGYAPDALGSEQIQSAAITLCVEGAPICIPIGDCDDLITATGTLCGAAGMDVEVVRQFFGAGHQQHVLLEVKLDDGSWYPLDPSNRAAPFGVKAPAQRETRHSPFDSKLTGLSDQAQFVGMGALPVWAWQGDRWHQVPAGVKLEGLGAQPQSIVVRRNAFLPAVVRARQFHPEQQVQPAQVQPAQVQLAQVPSAQGLGALVDDVIAAMKLAADPIAAGKLAWTQIQGRSWDQAITSARARAASKSWAKNDTASVNDLIVLIVSSAFTSRQAKDPSTADALNLTWLAFLKRMGIDPSGITTPQVFQKAKDNNASASILIPIAILGLILQVLVVGGVYAVAIYYAAALVNNYLAVSECDKELARLQAQLDAVVAQHNQDGKPLTPDEKNLQNQLLEQQKLVAGGCTRPAPLPTPPGFRQLPPGVGDEPQASGSAWPYVAIAGFVTATVLGVVYRKEIGDTIAAHRKT